ncbi:MAG: alpha-glucan family phosphorylase [Bacteroidia bacterium]|nr:alpha-glucan family phosphorylase [Bacteroidia bacterium]
MREELGSGYTPALLFEVSWEVVNKVGGIYTVLKGKAPLLHKQRGGRYWLVGPYLRQHQPEWEERSDLYADWREYFQREKGIHVHAGYWHIGDAAIPTLLVDFYALLARKNDIFAQWWTRFGVESLWGGWDYIEPAIFGYAAAQVIESFRDFYYGEVETLAHFHEWLTGGGVLYLRMYAPSIATLFTTHATVAGRAASGTLIPPGEVWSWLQNQNLLSKYTLERAAWLHADATTAVSEGTSREAMHYLGQSADMITPNGWEPPTNLPLEKARAFLQEIVRQWQWKPEETFWLMHSGRAELRNKGTYTLIEALRLYLREKPSHLLAVAFAVPGDTVKPATLSDSPLWVSHTLRYPEQDSLFQALRELSLQTEDPLRIAYLPVYLEGNDGIANVPYYALLGAMHASAFPSQYEPWGYTPQESLSLGIPTLSSQQAGFGQWMLSQYPSLGEALSLIDYNAPDPAKQVLGWLLRRLKDNPEMRGRLRREALQLAERTRWSAFLPFYQQSYQIALTKAQARLWYKVPTPASQEKESFTWHRAFFTPKLPEEIAPLRTLAYNLWWSWNSDTQQLFRTIDAEMWEQHENPVWLLNHLPARRWQELSQDEDFLKTLRQVYQRFEAYLQQPTQPHKPRVAYLCMEYGIAKCLPFYSGGLGVLAGDYLKEASDRGYPMIAVGLLYRQGYFSQRISPQGEQITDTLPLRFTDLPLEPVRETDGRWLRLRLPLGEKPIFLKVWRVDVGKVPLYLLDADLNENTPEQRAITSRLYLGDSELRLLQELVLGWGAQALIENLGLSVDIFHYNEGHPAFHLIAHWRSLMQKGLSLSAAQVEAQLRTLFTTHTPVPAGHDTFPHELLRPYLYTVVTQDLGVSWEEFLRWGEAPHDPGRFSLTAFCLRYCGHTNAVSQLHARVSQAMFAPYFPGYRPGEVPIRGITNGVHVSTWQAPEWSRSRRTWETHQMLRSALLTYLKRRLSELPAPVRYLEAVQAFFGDISETTLLMGFARRLATYKRHSLLLRHEPIAKLFAEAPVRLILAGKAHPQDEAGKAVLQEVWQALLQPPFLGKVLFVPDYDMQLARYLVQGVDVWLNMPIHGQEASGTSGMKAGLNGVLHISIPDGWWAEVNWEEAGGWKVSTCLTDDPSVRDAWEAAQLAYILREEVLPLYQTRDARGLPMGWINRMEKAQQYTLSRFSMGRVIEEYYQHFYEPMQAQLARLTPELRDAHLNLIKSLQENWNLVQITSLRIPPFAEKSCPVGTPFQVEAQLYTANLPPEVVRTELVFESSHGEIWAFPLERKENHTYTGEITLQDAGVYTYALRIYAWDPYLEQRLWSWVKLA